MPGLPESENAAVGSDAVKQRFREALERKHGRDGARAAHAEAGGVAKVHEVHGREGAKREFRRKSGG